MKVAVEKSRWFGAVLVFFAIAVAGCGAPATPSEEPTATTRQALTSSNGIWQNGLTTNGIWQNGIWQNGIWQNGIWQNGIWQNGIWQNGIWQNGIWQNGIWQNGIWQNGIWQNGSWENGIGQNGIWQNGIWQNGIWQNGIWQNGIPGEMLRSSSYARQLLQYVYACAMPGDVKDDSGQITLSSYSTTLDPAGGALQCSVNTDCEAGYSCSSDHTCVVPLTGAIGLGINADGSTWWGGRASDGSVGNAGNCDESCQRWVSACVLARTNAYGVHVDISMRAPANAPQAIKDALAVSNVERNGDATHVAYSLREGAYYGNIFGTSAPPPQPPSPDFDGSATGPFDPAGPVVQTPSFYACAGPGSNIPEVTKRFCSSQGDQVVINVPGVCLQSPTHAGVCAGDDTDSTSPTFGAISDCQAGDTTYKEVITVYLKTPIAVCGNAVCEAGENATSCPSDCPIGWARAYSPSLAGKVVDQNSFSSDFVRFGMSAVAPDDTVVVAGTASGDIDLGGGILPASQGVGVLAKYHSDGSFAWGARFGGLSLSEVNSVAVAPNGNVIVAGSGDQAIWISTYASDGVAVPDGTWTLPLGPDLTALQLTRALALDSLGNIVLAGTFSGQVTLGSETWTSDDGYGNYDANATFIAKLSPKGLVQWAWNLGAGRNSFPLSVVIDHADNIVLLTSTFNTNDGVAVVELQKRSSDGILLWTQTISADGSEGNSQFTAAAVDASGNVYASGYVGANGFYFAANGGPTPSMGAGGPFIMKYDADGSFQWANYANVLCPPSAPRCNLNFSESSYTEGVGIGFDPAGNAILASFGDPAIGGGIDFGVGTFPTYHSSNIFLSAYSPDVGQLVWAKQIPTILSSSLLGMAVDSQGRVVVSGNYSGSMLVANRMLVTDVPEQPGVIDSFVASFGGPSPNDKTPPAIGAGTDQSGTPISTVPRNILAQATSLNGAVVFFMAPTSIDTGYAGTSVACSPPPNTMFPIGTTTVTCTASDPLGNQSAADFQVTVVDVGPVFSAVSNISVPAADASGATVTFELPTSIDQIDGSSHPVTCDPPSGSVFVVGKTRVKCTATDDEGNQSQTGFLVNVLGTGTDTTPPSITVPAPMTVPAANASGAVVTYSASATDDVGVVTFSCSKASGASFPLGTTTVTCSATDAAGNPSSVSFAVTVADKTAPALALPPNITAEASGPGGAGVLYAASATDNVDSTVGISCSSSSGGVFPLGITTVNCTATDAAHNSASGSFTVTVFDTTSPLLVLPGPISASAIDANGAPVSYSASALDLVDGTVTPNCAPASGSTFHLGTTVVTCSATDAHGNSSGASFAVTVVESTPPVLNLPATITATATSTNGAPISYSASATDLVDGTITPVCTKASGSTFPFGTTTVTCTATNSRGSMATGSFQVQVQYAWSGILQPINADNTSVFKLNSTVPVKFQLTGASAGISNALANLSLSKVPSSVTGTSIEAVSTSAATTGNAFRYDSGQYIFNLSTKGLSTGSWLLSIDLHDGVTRTVTISLR